MWMVKSAEGNVEAHPIQMLEQFTEKLGVDRATGDTHLNAMGMVQNNN